LESNKKKEVIKLKRLKTNDFLFII